MRIAAIAVLGVLFACAASGADKEKLPVPDTVSRKTVAKLVEGVFGEQFRKTSTVAERSELAKEIFKTARESTGDSAEVYVLFRVARDVAAAAGDIDTAMRAVHEIDAKFDIDVNKMCLDVIKESASAKTSADAKKHIAQVAATLANDAIARERFEVAKQMIDGAVIAARASRNKVTIADMVKRSREIADIAVEYEKVKGSLKNLDQTLRDPEASLKTGKFLCLVIGDWTKGLPLLAAGADAGLRSASQLDAKTPSDTKTRVRLADQWWTVGQQLTGTAQDRVLQRAAHWYGKALEDEQLKGFNLQKAKLRIAKITATSGRPTNRVGRKPTTRPTGKSSLKVINKFQVAPSPRIASLSVGGKILLLVDTKGKMRLYRTKNGKLVDHELQEKGVAGGGFTFVDNVVITAPWEGGAKLWDLKTGQNRGGPGCWQTKTITCARNGTWMAVGQFRGKVSVSDMRTNKEVIGIAAFGRGDPVEGLAFSHDGQYIAAVTRHGAGKIFSLPGGEQTADLGGGLRTTMAFTSDGRALIASRSQGTIQVRNPKNGENLGVWQGHGAVVRGISTSKDGFVVTVSDDMTARLWQPKDGRSKVLWKHNAPLGAVGFSQDDQHLVAVGDDGTAQGWEVSR